MRTQEEPHGDAPRGRLRALLRVSLSNALDHLPRKVATTVSKDFRWLYDRRDVSEAQKDLSAWLQRWQKTYPKLYDWVEENIAETLTFYRLPRGHHKHLRAQHAGAG